MGQGPWSINLLNPWPALQVEKVHKRLPCAPPGHAKSLLNPMAVSKPRVLDKFDTIFEVCHAKMGPTGAFDALKSSCVLISNLL